MYNIPDNYDRFVSYEREQERLKRLEHRREIEEEFDTYDLPFYEDQEVDIWAYTKVYL